MDIISGPGLFSGSSLPVRSEGNVLHIRNLATGRWLVATPEEAVRQGLLWHLVHQANYPRPMISTERSIRVGRMVKRFDIIVLDRQGHPFLLAECKAPSVPLSPAVAEQAARYNSMLKAPYLLITNGLEVACYQITDQGYAPMANWPPAYPAV